MQNIAIYSTSSEVMHVLLKYLEIDGYKNVNVNLASLEITAEHRRSLFKTNKFYFKIVHVSPTITNIEIKVNPKNENPTPYDLKKETAFAERIYTYF